jgi:integrase
MRSKAEILDRLDVALRLKGRDHKTRDSYCRTAGHFYDFTLTCPRTWSSEQKAEAYLTRRVRVDQVSASTQNHDLAALNALYASQGRKLGNVDALRAKRPVYERHCPSTPELLALVDTLVDTAVLPARTLALLMAGTGLRVDEALSIRIKDFRPEGDRVRLVVREPKHGHDRVVQIPPSVLPMLRRQAQHAKRVFLQDQESTPPLPLAVPHALARKYPRAPFSPGWMFLFPSVGPMRHPETKVPHRWHLPDYAVQKAFGRACDTLERVGRIAARITPHCLRHWYGTYFQGDIRDLQAILGHKSLETTQTYRHPQLDRAVSPLEALQLAS